MPSSGYPLPPREPAGGWKNQAQWIGNVEYWSEQMAKAGFTLEEFMSIYTKHTGDPYPKNLKNSFEAKKALFPGADMLNEYDMDNHMKRRFPHHSLEGDKGYGEWVPMSDSEIRAANQYHAWQNDPRNEWQILGSGDNAYIAWLANWGDKFKSADWVGDTDPGWQMPSTDIHTGADLGGGWTPGRTMGMNVPPKPGAPNAPGGTPTTPSPNSPGPTDPIPQGVGNSGSWLRGTGAVTPGTPPTTGFAASTTGGWTPQGTYTPQRPNARRSSAQTSWWNYGQY